MIKYLSHPPASDVADHPLTVVNGNSISVEDKLETLENISVSQDELLRNTIYKRSNGDDLEPIDVNVVCWSYQLLLSIAFDCVTVAVVAYAVSLSMAKIFARKRGYEVCNNQELLAQGLSNTVGSFFSCMPVAASLSRSLLQEAVGGQTQVRKFLFLLFSTK